MNEDSRLNEWFVPKFGSLKFRAFVGLLFLPYTGMCISFTVIGAMLSPTIQWDRVAAIVLIYGFALGVSAHAADNLGSKKNKPWGKYFSVRQLWLLMILGLSIAYSIGIYYIIFHVPLLVVIALIEGFFVFAYNFELFKGLLHNDIGFVFSWGALPVLGGYVIQTNSVGTLSILMSVSAALISWVHIKISRPYKELKRKKLDERRAGILEQYLKLISLGTIAAAFVAIFLRVIF
ncbi:MAG TPA: hypothetical protein VFI73_08330 [Candidatus Nitrosopolaris sp.]|nr:hypothetical protein [Candidatus Nitrosopolaris sp.]